MEGLPVFIQGCKTNVDFYRDRIVVKGGAVMTTLGDRCIISVFGTDMEVFDAERRIQKDNHSDKLGFSCSVGVIENTDLRAETIFTKTDFSIRTLWVSSGSSVTIHSGCRYEFKLDVHGYNGTHISLPEGFFAKLRIVLAQNSSMSGAGNSTVVGLLYPVSDAMTSISHMLIRKILEKRCIAYNSNPSAPLGAEPMAKRTCLRAP